MGIPVFPGKYVRLRTYLPGNTVIPMLYRLYFQVNMCALAHIFTWKYSTKHIEIYCKQVEMNTDCALRNLYSLKPVYRIF